MALWQLRVISKYRTIGSQLKYISSRGVNTKHKKKAVLLRRRPRDAPYMWVPLISLQSSQSD